MSLIELLVSLTITSLLLTATMVAVNASFAAYASAARQASTQTATRMVTHRLLHLIRTSTAHGPLVPDALVEPPVTLAGNTITSNFMELFDVNGEIIRVEFRVDDQELWLISNPGEEDEVAQPLISGVTNCQFFCSRRLDDDGVWVLDRGTMDLTVQPSDDTTLDIEDGFPDPIRMIASTMPRKVG